MSSAFCCVRCGKPLAGEYVDRSSGPEHLSPAECVAAGAPVRRVGVVMEWRGLGRHERVLVVLEAIDLRHAYLQVDLRAFGTYFNRTGDLVDPSTLDLGVYEDDGRGGWKLWSERAA